MVRARNGTWLTGMAVASAAAAVGIPSGSASAGTIRHDRSPGVHVALADAYPSVGAIYLDTAVGAFLSASGVLIHPEWVLTAAHVVDENGIPPELLGEPVTPYFVPGPDSIVSGTIGPFIEGDNWFPHPNWDKNANHGYDIGLLHLSEPITDIVPATLYAGSDELDRVGTTVGYGHRGTGETGAITNDGLRRAGQNILDATGDEIPNTVAGWPISPHLIFADFDDPDDVDGFNYFGGDALPLDLEYMIASGDSGGGTFVDFGDGPVLVGISSVGGAFETTDDPAGDGVPDSSYSDVYGITRVSLFHDWILTSAAIPEPTGVATALLILATVLGNRRRRRVAR
jgi:hypothetical protein